MAHINARNSGVRKHDSGTGFEDDRVFGLQEDICIEKAGSTQEYESVKEHACDMEQVKGFGYYITRELDDLYKNYNNDFKDSQPMRHMASPGIVHLLLLRGKMEAVESEYPALAGKQ